MVRVMSMGAIVISLAAAGTLTTAEPGTWSSKAAHLWPGPTASALAGFEQRFAKCPEEFPSLAAVDWLEGSRELAVVVEMPCHSSSSDMCRFNGYIIDPVSGVISRRLTESDVRREWAGAIGPRLEITP